MQNFGICVPFWNEIAHFYGPQITLYGEHFAKTTLKIKTSKFWKLDFSVSFGQVYLRNR